MSTAEISTGLDRKLDLINDPKKVLDATVDNFAISEQFKREIWNYITALVDMRSADRVDHSRLNYFQEMYQEFQDQLLTLGLRKTAGVLFNIHRVLTNFSGYSADSEASSDVDAFFNDPAFEIPEKGLLWVEGFSVRNLARIVEICEERGGEELVSRIRICDVEGVVAAAILTMSDSKKAEFEKALSKLSAEQVLIQDRASITDITTWNLMPSAMESSGVAMWFAPRVHSIMPSLTRETEARTIEAYTTHFGEMASFVVEGGRVFVNMAFPKGEEWRPMETEVVASRSGDRKLVKLTGISESVAHAVVETLLDEGFVHLPKDGVEAASFDPATVDSTVDHTKAALWAHFKKVKA